MPNVPSPSLLRIQMRFYVALALMIAACSSALAADDAGETEPAVRHGLVARYTAADGTTCTRLDEALRFVWRGSPDIRIPPGRFRATWDGLLLTTTPGRYTLRVFAQGEVSLAVGGNTVLEDTADEARWLVATPLELDYGYHPIHVTYASHGRVPQLKLHWDGPKFQLEPISPRWLFHRSGNAPDDRFERGARLVRELRCDSCHHLNKTSAPSAAPALNRLPGNLSYQWVTKWLAEAAQAAPPESERSDAEPGIRRRMPHFDLSKADAEAIAAYLFAKPPPISEASRSEQSEAKHPLGAAQSGEKLFRTIGCLACHRVGELGNSGLFGGGDLTLVAHKRPPGFFARWLAEPKSINVDHSMPAYTESVISPHERADLAAYLATLADPAGQEFHADRAPPPRKNDALKKRGRELVTRWRCGACHQLPETDEQLARVAPLSDEPDWEHSCLSQVEPESYRPAYALSAQQRAAVRHYFETVRNAPASQGDSIDGGRLLSELNCLACHARDLELGIAPSLAAVIEADDQLRPLLPGLVPLSLTEVGDKLPVDELHRSIRGREQRHRPWLAVRMPKFTALGDADVAALAQYLVDVDRSPELAAPGERTVANSHPNETMTPDAAALRVAGSRLVTSAGFGCTSCHQIGSAAPQNVELQSRGADLTMLGARVRRAWFDRWVRNPARGMPRMEMPSVQIPVRGVLDDDLDAQLSAVWHVLNEVGFEPPRPGPVRVVRSSNRPRVNEPASVLTDVLEGGGLIFVKPLLVGLPNRHNVLFDLDAYRLAAWWIGDTARQHTRGKTWYWEPGGVHVVAPTTGGRELELLDAKGTVYIAEKQGQFVAEFDWFEKVPGGVRFAARLQFRGASSKDNARGVTVTQTFTSAPPGAGGSPSTGWRRGVEVAHLPEGFALRWRPFGAGKLARALKIDPEGRSITGGTAGRDIDVRVTKPPDARFRREGRDVWLSIPAVSHAGNVRWEVEYRTHLPVDRFFVPRAEPVVSPVTALDVVPGFEAHRLPLPRSIMPTGFTWRPDGTLVTCSLKGRVWIAHDTDGDGLEDSLSQFSDELAAPYGLSAQGDALDVINKYGLLRLWDRDGDGRADRTELVASGWGHSADYHDWAIGLPRDELGNYFVAFPCQQDDRRPLAARLRGAAVKLIGRRPTPDDPRLYKIETICAGLRFPMGLARNHNGDLFATDNQGNYNPFNELNHLVAGARYGFINKLENGPGFSPPLRDPAINIPHPWTRSVNGICFLYTPPKVREALGRDLFGPFEGHLVGCEYDTRRLIRMSLQKVGDTYQGAAYPFSLDPQQGVATFMGPVVCQVSPLGDLYVGEMRDSGWGAGANVGGIVRLRPTGRWPSGIAEVLAAADGFIVQFTAPVDELAAARASNYSLVSYRRISTPDYGGPDVDRKTVNIQRVELSEDARQARLLVDRLREGFVYELRTGNIGAGGEALQVAEAHYTLNRVPAN